jgi:hypothetical protein
VITWMDDSVAVNQFLLQRNRGLRINRLQTCGQNWPKSRQTAVVSRKEPHVRS